MSTSKAIQPFPGALPALQSAIDRYMEECQPRLTKLLQNRLSLQECFQIQKRYFIQDFLRNPINALWAVPYFSVRKMIDASEKLGWDSGRTLLTKIPQSLKTDFQKEIERIISAEVFGLPIEPATPCDFTRELEKETELRQSLSEDEWKSLVQTAQNSIRTVVSEHCARQNGFTDLASSGGVLIMAHLLFKDRSLDIYGMGKRLASQWARKDAINHFAFGQKLGRAFYSVAPPPPPTTSQVVLATAIGIFLLALFSTAIGILSYPVQKFLGFRRQQLETLLNNVSDKLLIEMTKTLKKPSK